MQADNRLCPATTNPGEAEHGKAVELTRRGEPVAVLIGLLQYEHLTGHRCGFLDAVQQFRGEFGLAGLALDPDELFADVRDGTRGRDVRV